MLRFEGIDIVIPDSLGSLKARQPLLDPVKCGNYAYLLHYRFQQDRFTQYIFVVKMSAAQQVLEPLRIPNRPVCRLISPFVAFREASRLYDRLIKPLDHIELAYNKRIDNFVWRFTSKSETAETGTNALGGRVEVDAMNGNIVHQGIDTSNIPRTPKF